MTSAKLLANFITLPQISIENYFPLTITKRPLKSLDVLILINSYPGLPAGGYMDLISNFGTTIPKHIHVLLSLNYIKKRSRKRFVGQIQQWKPEDVYNISPKGERVLSEILELLEGEKNVVRRPRIH